MNRNIVSIFYSNRIPITLLEIALTTLRKYTPDSIINLFVYNVRNSLIAQLSKRLNLKIIRLARKDWVNRKMACRVEKIKEIDKCYGDNLILLDIDLIFKADPFEIFKNDFDVFVTTRYYEHIYPINAGIHGFKYNRITEKFIDFYISQIHNPTWEPLVTWRKKFHRNNSLDWRVGQDFLCVIFLVYQLQTEGCIRVPWVEDKNLIKIYSKFKLPFNIKIYDAGPKYNYAPNAVNLGVSKKMIDDVIEKIRIDNEIKIIHLLGPLHNKKSLKILGLIR